MSADKHLRSPPRAGFGVSGPRGPSVAHSWPRRGPQRSSFCGNWPLVCWPATCPPAASRS